MRIVDIIAREEGTGEAVSVEIKLIDGTDVSYVFVGEYEGKLYGLSKTSVINSDEDVNYDECFGSLNDAKVSKLYPVYKLGDDILKGFDLRI